MIEWAVTSSVLILVVLILRRLLMGRISLRLQYGLWALVLVRLLVPVNFGSTEWSVLNVMAAFSQTHGTAVPASVGEAEEITPRLSIAEPDPDLRPELFLVEPDASFVPEMPPVEPESAPVPEREAAGAAMERVARTIWAVGAVGVGLWLAGVNVRFARMLRRSRVPLTVEHCPRPVYVTGAAQTPCLFGLFHPCIYVTQEVAADKTVLRHSLAHEFTHYCHKDHIWAVLRGLCLALHWYNPLVWLAAILSRRDGELCCDEVTVRRLGEGERAAYGRTLLAVTCQGRANPLLTATSMTGSGRGITERIVLLAKRPRTTMCTLAAVVLIAAAAVGCTFTGAQSEQTQAGTVYVFSQTKEITGISLEGSGGVIVPVDAQHREEMAAWLRSFTLGEAIPEGEALEPGVNSVSATVTYADGKTQFSGIDVTEWEGTRYRIQREELPDCWQELWGGQGEDQNWSTADVERWTKEVSLVGLSVKAEGSEEEIGRQWAETFAAQYRNLSPDNPLYSTDSAVLECTPYAQSLLSQPREQIYLMRFACHAVDKASFEQWYANAAQPLTGEEYPQYEGWMGLGWFVVLEEQQKDQWVCTNAGTGGYGEWGYLNYETGEIWEQILEEQLSVDSSQADPEMVLRILPFVDWSRLDGDELNRLWEILNLACITQGRVYGPEEDRMWSDVYPDDQAYRDLYVMLAALNTDGAYGEWIRGLLEKQRAYDPELFDSCLENFTQEQQSVIRRLTEL